MNVTSLVSQTEKSTLLLAITLSLPACDQSEDGLQAPRPTSPGPGEIEQPDALGGMTYEDAGDFAVLHDASNLKPPSIGMSEYQHLLQQRDREELRLLFADMTPTATPDLEHLSLRWFVQGVGVVAQNHSEHAFTLAAIFSSSTEEDCHFSVPWRTVNPKQSIIFSHQNNNCPADHADVLIKDEYGFVVDSTTINLTEGQR